MTACLQADRLLERLFADPQPSPRVVSRLRAHLDTCPACLARYERMLHMERLLASGGTSDSAPAQFELARIQARLFSQLPPEPWLRRWVQALLRPYLLVPALATAAGLLAVVSLTLSGPRVGDEEFTPRGAGAPAADAFRVRAFCHVGDRIHSLSARPGPQELSACPVGGEVLLAYQADTPGILYALSLGADGALRWLSPESRDTQGPPLPAATSLTPLRLGVRKEGSFAPTKLVLVLARSSLSKAAVEEAVRASIEPNVLAARLDAHVQTLEIRWEPAGGSHHE